MALAPWTFQCKNPECNESFDQDDILAMSDAAVRIGDSSILINGSCRKCDLDFALLLPSDYPSGGELFDAITKAGKDDWSCDLPDDFLPPGDEESQEWVDDHEFVPQVKPKPVTPFVPVVKNTTSIPLTVSKAVSLDTNDKGLCLSGEEKDPAELFSDAIKRIDKNLSKIKQTDQILDNLNIILELPSPRRKACLDALKLEFGLTARDIEAYNVEINKKIKELVNLQKQDEYNKLLDQCSVLPKELTEEEKKAANEYLIDPNLVDNISRDLAEASGIIEEETNKMMLYLASISRKTDKPISLVVFGQSSSGKSFLANAIEKFIPPEDKLTLSSSSARAFEYLGAQLKHKSILIQEWEGAENILPTIRTIQSEGKLARIVTIKNPEDGSFKAVASTIVCPCSVIITTTKETIHDENSTRIFELFVGESVPQIGKVVRSTIDSADIRNRTSKSRLDYLVNLHQDVQRCLERVEVTIPYAKHLTFPSKNNRNKRDSARFIQLIKVVAFLRQKQKPIKVISGERCIEADLKDYETAYRLCIEVIKNTLNPISDRAKNLLKVCCQLTDELGKGKRFTVKQIQEKAAAMELDFSNRSDIDKQFAVLTQGEYLDLSQPGGKGSKCFYKVCFDYVRDKHGNLLNVDNPDIKVITTPEQLAEIMQQPDYLA